MTGDEPGICIHCQTERGPVGERCAQPGCVIRAQRFIPIGWYESAREYAARVRKPLDPNLGRQLDKYLLCGLLGEGGMGSVYLALQMPLFREVAVKVISGLNLSDTAMLRFEREARAVSALDHPNIVRLYDYGVGVLDFPIPFMVLEYVRHGRTLGEALARVRADNGGRVPVAVVREVFRQILHALAAAHKVGIVHRDIKPDNVMVVPVEGNPYLVKLLDFGLAKAVAEVTGADVSRTGQIVGTPYYMAPEQAPARGKPRADARSDLYAVAVMLYEVFTGLRAYDGQTPLEVLLKKADPEYRPLDREEAKVSPRLRALLERGMAVDPARRFASADEMLDALEDALREAEAAAIEPAVGLPVPARERPATPPSETRARFADSDGPISDLGPTMPERGVGPDATPGWVVAAGEEARIQENPSLSSEETVPHERRSRLRAPGWAMVLIAVVVAGAGLLWIWPTGDESVPEETSSASAADLPAITSRDTFVPPEPVGPPPTIVARGFLVETSPPDASVLVDGHPLGRSPIRFEFRASDDSWTSREVEVRAQREGYLETLARIPLAQAVLEGRVALVLKPAPRPRPARSKAAARGLDGILGPDVAAPPAPRPAPPPAVPEPPAPKPPPARIEVPML